MLTTSFILAPAPVAPRCIQRLAILEKAGSDSLNRDSSPAGTGNRGVKVSNLHLTCPFVTYEVLYDEGWY